MRTCHLQQHYLWSSHAKLPQQFLAAPQLGVARQHASDHVALELQGMHEARAASNSLSLLSLALLNCRSSLPTGMKPGTVLSRPPSSVGTPEIGMQQLSACCKLC